MPDFRESITIDAPPDHVFTLVSDLPRMGEWSPECTRVTWAAGTTGAAVGARFIGHNRAGAIRWFTQGKVTDATPGRSFAFRIHFGPVPIALWTYTFTGRPTDGSAVAADQDASSGGGSGTGVGDGCVVEESWTDLRPAAMRTAFGWIFGDRNKRNQYGIRTTLTRLKAAAEAPGQPT